MTARYSSGLIGTILRLLVLLVTTAWMVCAVGCSRRADPSKDANAVLEHARDVFHHGDTEAAEIEAQRGYERFHQLGADWAWKFTILKASVLSWRGKPAQVLALLASQPALPTDADLKVKVMRLEGFAYLSRPNFAVAEQKFREAESICAASHPPACGDLPSAWGWFEMNQEHYAAAEEQFTRALAADRQSGDRFLEATALLNLSWCADEQTHWDEALDWADRSRAVALPAKFDDIAETALGNMGWAYYKLGDFEKAEGMFSEASEQARALGDVSSEAAWMTNAGYVHMDQHDYAPARQFFSQSLALARSINSRDDIADALVARALVSELTGQLDDAKRNADEAFAMARADNHKRDEEFARLVQGKLAADARDPKSAEAAFHEVEQAAESPAYLKWDAEHSLARLYEDGNAEDAAEREYHIAIGTFESARSALQHEDSRLPFLNNASGIYDDYIHFLIAHGKSAKALQMAEYQRGRTLAEGLGLLKLGLLKKGPPKTLTLRPTQGKLSGAKNARELGRPAASVKDTAFPSDPTDPTAIARHAGGVILFYSLGEKQSYLWAITSQKIGLFVLPAKSEIDAVVQRYRKALTAQQEFLPQANADGRALYRMLVAPAASLLAKEGKVFIVPDGSLNTLNFETLIVDDPAAGSTPHYWIEDATIADATSLRMLSASHGAASQRLKPRTHENAIATAKAVPFHTKPLPTAPLPTAPLPNTSLHTGSLLLMGDAVAASADYPELLKAGDEMQSIEKHFPASAQQVFARERATPAAYLSSHPGEFAYIHFVAHGTASRTSPLDSAIILSSASQHDDSFKLYARDIVNHPLHADLVTISTCYGAGARAYYGEGLVGLSWAFLRAGSHNVIGALWEVSDVSPPQLMDNLYGELMKGERPDTALREAKLSLLNSKSAFRKPFYWAPFQLYTGWR